MAHEALAVGEVLWDLLPEGRRLGGAPGNFAYHCRCLGADSRLVTRVGDDALDREVLRRFRDLGLPVEAVQVDADRPTGTAEVAIDAGGQPRYTIIEDVAWDRIEATDVALRLAARADAVCFGTLAQRSETSRRSIRSLVVAAKPGAIRLLDVNFRPPFVDAAIVAESLDLADALKLNDEELPALAAMLGLPDGVREPMAELAHRYRLSLVALTRGAQGSLLLADGEWSDAPGIHAQVVDNVGAGDAFTAALVVGWLAGRPLDEINARANEVAAYVCSQPGGTPPLPPSLRYPDEARP